MSDEERSASEHRSVLNGMTRDEARALAKRAFSYAAGNPALTIDEVQKACALAALGAEVVGAKEFVDGMALCGNNYTAKLARPNRVLVLEGE